MDKPKKPYEPWNYAKQDALWRAEHCRKGLEEYFKKRDERELRRRADIEERQ